MSSSSIRSSRFLRVSKSLNIALGVGLGRWEVAASSCLASLLRVEAAMKIPISKITGHGSEGSRRSMTGLQILLFNNLNFSLVPSPSLSSFDPVFWDVPPHLFISTHLFISFSTKENFMEKNQTLTVIFVWNTLELPQSHVATIPGQESESG